MAQHHPNREASELTTVEEPTNDHKVEGELSSSESPVLTAYGANLKSSKKGPAEPSHRLQKRSSSGTLMSVVDGTLSTDDDDSHVHGLLRNEWHHWASAESSGESSSSSSVEISRYRYQQRVQKQSRRSQHVSRTENGSSIQNESSSTVVPLTEKKPSIETLSDQVVEDAKTEVARSLNKRKDIRTAEDRKRAIATKNGPENPIPKKRKPPTRVLPGKAGHLKSESDDSSDSPDPEVTPVDKKKQPVRKATARKCPVEQIDVDCAMGHRPYMEDALVALQDITAYLPDNCPTKHTMEPTAFFGVYDGHGGSQASRFVQKFFHMRLLEKLKETRELNGEERFDIHSVVEEVYRRIDHDFMRQCNVPVEGIPPLLGDSKSMKSGDGHSEECPKKERQKRKQRANKRAEAFTSGPYVQRIMTLQRERTKDKSSMINTLRNIPTRFPGESISIDELIRDPRNFDKLNSRDERSFRRFLKRFERANPEYYQDIKSGKTEFRRSISSANSSYENIKATDTWSDGSFFTSDDNASELSGVDSDLGAEILLGEDPDDNDEAPILRVKDDPMTKNPPTSGSTICVCLLDKKFIYSSWVGDSEAVLFRRGGVIISLTNPHSPLREDEADRIRKLGGVVLKQSVPQLKKVIGRVQGQLSVSRAIGDAHLKRWVISDPELMKTPLIGTEEFAVIASDGLWDVLSFKEVYRLISRYITADRHHKRVQRSQNKTNEASKTSHWYKAQGGPKEDAMGFESGYQTIANETAARQRKAATHQKRERNSWSGCARYLIRTALTCGSSDNISVIVIFFKAGIEQGRSSAAFSGTEPSSPTTDLPELLGRHSRSTRIGSTDDSSTEGLSRRNGDRRGLFSGVGIFNRARIKRVFARTVTVELGSNSEDDKNSFTQGESVLGTQNELPESTSRRNSYGTGNGELSSESGRTLDSQSRHSLRRSDLITAAYANQSSMNGILNESDFSKED